jgi:glycosyltransferase involved in cell wall biosynthesis
MLPSNLKVALVYDWLTAEFGGAEHILIALHHLFPVAPLFTSVWDQEKTPWTKGWDVHTSFLQNIPWLRSNHKLAAPLLPLAFESFDLKEFDVVISITSFAAKGVLTLPHQLHVSYVLTPPRFLHTHTDTYWKQYTTTSLTEWLSKPILQYLRRWDRVAAFRPDTTIAISHLVSQRINDIYKLPISSIVYPPVPAFTIAKNHPAQPISIQPQWWRNNAAASLTTIEKPLITGGRLVAYKQFDSVITLGQDFNQPVIIFGDGPEKENLQIWADNCSIPVILTGALSQNELEQVIANSSLAIYPAEEDFGITQVQIAQTGLPLILHEKSGAAELIKDWPNVKMVSVSSLEHLLQACKNTHSFMQQKLQPKSKIYGTTTFGESFLKAVNLAWKKHSAVLTSSKSVTRRV